jgi:hypothetical protein
MTVCHHARHSAAIALAIVVMSMPTVASSTEDAAAKAFVGQLVAASNADDHAARRALLHPQAVACADLLRTTMGEAAFAPKRQPVPSAYRWNIAPMADGSAGWFADNFDYPVRPTHQLQVDFETVPHRTESLMFQIVKLDDQWREIAGCPRPETILQARRAGEQRGQQNARIAELVKAMPPALESEIRRHFAEGRRIDAYRHYRDATREDLAIAKGVVDTLMSEAASGVMTK